MDEAAITTYIAERFEGVNHVQAGGDHYFIWDPARNFPPNKQIPFATVVTSDAHDTVSNLNRGGVYRLNVGLSKATFQSMFGEPNADRRDDYGALDTIMPHPTYSRQNFICVLNPSDATFEKIKPMLDEAYAVVVNRKA